MSNVVFLSNAQRASAGDSVAPVIRLPISPNRYEFRSDKEQFLLFLGRVSAWKGAREAALFARTAGLHLVVAGPCWETDYKQSVEAAHAGGVSFLGEIGGTHRLELLAAARAVLALSQTVPGPWSSMWVEPGSMLVAEAAVSGTPVIATPNGCLSEIVPGVGAIVPEGVVPGDLVHAALRSLPDSEAVRALAIKRFGHYRIAGEYISLYRRIVGARIES